MADVTKEQLNELVSRATAAVLKEMPSGASGAFGVSELRAQVADLGKIGGANVAWEISYKTSLTGLEKIGDAIRPGAAIAWEISYKTSKTGFEKETPIS